MDSSTEAGSIPGASWHQRYIRMLVPSIVLIIMTSIWTIMRILSRRVGNFRFQLEDYIYFLGQFLYYGLCDCAIAIVAVGPPTNNWIMSFKYRVMLAFKLCYATVLLCVKTSIILLIRRIFATGSRYVNAACWVALVLAFGWALYAGIIEFVICQPVQSAWDPMVPRKKCIDSAIAYSMVPACDIPIELLILVIPVAPILKLRIARPHKVALLVMFCAGFITIILSVIYLIFINVDIHASYWVSILHGGIALMVASSTVLQPLFNTAVRSMKLTVLDKSSNPHTPSHREDDGRAGADSLALKVMTKVDEGTDNSCMMNGIHLRPEQIPSIAESEEFLSLESQHLDVSSEDGHPPLGPVVTQGSVKEREVV